MAAMSRQVLVETVRNFKEKLPNAILIFEKLVKENPPVTANTRKTMLGTTNRVIIAAAINRNCSTLNNTIPLFGEPA